MDITASGGSTLYSLNPIHQLTATAETLRVSAELTADGGTFLTINGKQIPGANARINEITDIITVIGSATATGGTTFSHISNLQRASGSGDFFVYTSTGGLIATLGEGETYLSNDVRKINRIVDRSNDRDVQRYDYNNYQKGNPNDSNLGSYAYYDLDYDSQLRLLNVQNTTDVFRVLFQRQHKLLINDKDRSEFPEDLYPAIVEAAYEGWGLRYQDEQDGVLGKQLYDSLREKIVRKWLSGRERKPPRVIPAWYKRRI